jgi:hypothetical protein
VVERCGLRRRGAPAVPARRDTPAVPAGSDGTPAVPDKMEGGSTGGKGEERNTCCSCRDRVTSRGSRGEGEKRWSRGGVRTRVEGDPVRDFGDGRVSGGGAVGNKVGVSEDGVPKTGGEGRAVAQVAGVGLEESLGAGTGDKAGPKVGVQESSAHEVGAFKGERGREAVGSGTDGRRVGSSKGKRGRESQRAS